MSRGEYLAGFGCLAVVLGGCGGASACLVARRLRWMAIQARVVAWAVLTAALLAFAHLLPLALGILTRGTAMAASVVVLLVSLRVRPAERAPGEESRGHPSSVLEWLPALAAVGISISFVLAYLHSSYAVALGDIDSTGFHFPVIARWIQTGSVWSMYDFVPGWGFGAYPQTGNLLQLAVVLPWHDDFLLRAVGPAELLLCAAAGYALAVELGARRAPAALTAAVAVMVPAAVVPSLDHGQTDILATAGLVSGALFLTRHARTRRTPDLVLAGVALGLAFGTKWYGPPEAAVLLVVWAAGRLTAGRRAPGQPLVELAGVGALTVLVGGFWLVRNTVASGDPLFPAHVAPLGVTLFAGSDAVSDHLGPALVHHFGDAHAWRTEIWPAFRANFTLPGGLFGLGALAALGVAVRRRCGRVALVTVGALALLVTYTFLPETALRRGPVFVVVPGVRYAVPGLLIAAAVSAWVISRLGRTALIAELALLGGLADALAHEDRRAPQFDAVHVRGVVLALVALAVLAGAVFLLRRRPPRPAMRAGIAVVLLAALAVGARRVDTRFDAARYHDAGGPLAWIQTHSGSGVRVALAGSTGHNPYSSPYLAFGPRLRNHVAYVGYRRNSLLVAYQRPGPFLRSLAAGDYHFLLIGRAPRHTPEISWARTAGWLPVTSDGIFTLLRAPGAGA